MIHFLSASTRLFYKHIGKPLCFMVQPDLVHQRLVATGRLVQRSSLLRRGIAASWSYQNPHVLSQTIHGITFKNPVGLSAGFDKNFALPPLMKSVGFGFMEGGSVTLHECAGNPKPWFYRLPKSQSLVVHAGLANDGVDRITDRINRYDQRHLRGFPLNISVAKTNSPGTCTDTEAVADYIGSLKRLKRARTGSMFTLNISCPNTYGGEPFTTPERLELLLLAVDRLRITQPVFIKMPSHLSWKEFEPLVKVAALHHIDGLTIGNLAKDRKAAKLSDPLPDSVKGNLSGKPTQKITDDLIRQTYCAYGKRFVIIGVGGIFSAKDAYRKIKLGASLVELITGMIFVGPQLIGQINEELVELIKKDGYKTISEAIGVDAHS